MWLQIAELKGFRIFICLASPPVCVIHPTIQVQFANKVLLVDTTLVYTVVVLKGYLHQR